MLRLKQISQNIKITTTWANQHNFIYSLKKNQLKMLSFINI